MDPSDAARLFIIIRSLADEPAGFEPVILHFDAKYRVSFIAELFGEKGRVAGRGGRRCRQAQESSEAALYGADLLKMHATETRFADRLGHTYFIPGATISGSRSRLRSTTKSFRVRSVRSTAID